MGFASQPHGLNRRAGEVGVSPGPEPSLHPLRASAAELAPTPSLESVARHRLLGLVVGLAFLHVVIGFGHLRNPAGWNLHSPLTALQDTPWSRSPAFVLAIATAFFLLVLRLLLPRLPLRWSNPLGALVAALLVLNALGWFTLGLTPEKTVPVAFAVFGAGCLLFTTRSLVLVMILAVGGWSWFARTAGFTSGWPYFGTVLLGACFLALIFQRLHLHTLRQMLRTAGGPGGNRQPSSGQEGDEHFRRWYEATFEGIAIHEKGIILEANQALASLRRCDLATLPGQNLLEWFTRASRNMIEESILLGNFRPFEAVARGPDKTELHLELFSKRIAYGGKEVMVTAFRDITERQRAAAALNTEQQRLQHQYRRQVALAQLTVSLGQSTEIARSLDTITQTAATVLPAGGGACLLFHEAGHFTVAAASLPQAQARGFDPAVQFARVAGWIRDHAESFIASDISREDPFAVNHPVRFVSAFIGVPLFDGDTLLAVLFVLESEEPRHFLPDEMDFINELASHAAMAIAKSRLYERLSEAGRRLEKQSALLQVQNEQLVRAKVQAESVSDAKSEFLAKVSHELRTPLNGVMGMTDYLLTTELNPDQRESAETVRASAEHLLGQINRILDFSRLETGLFTPLRAEFDVREMAAGLRTKTELCRGDKPITVSTNVHATVPRRLCGDTAALHRALWHLLDNAVRFTEQGQVCLEIQAEPAGEASIMLHCTVRDTGRGLSPEIREGLFDPFAQADNSLARQHEGLGLGLATTKRLVERLHGRITVVSTPGHGSTFTVAVPMAIAGALDATVIAS
jgi:PAS domain S-box-containing protein